MKLDLESLLADIRKGKAPSLLLLHGDDFQVHTAAQAILDLMVPAENRAFNLERFDGRSASWDQIEAALMTPPFLAGAKTVWVEDAPYFASAENKGEIGEKALRLWGEGKRDEAARLLADLLRLEGWTQERWEKMEGRPAAEIAALLGDGGKEAEALLAFCREQGMDLSRGSGGEAERLVEFLERGLPSWGVLLLTASHVDRRMRLYKKFVEQGAVLDLSLERERSGKIERKTLAEFLDRRLKEAGKRIEPRAREMVLARAGTELWAVHQELEKLLLYVGDEAWVRAEDVEDILLDQGEGWVFDLTRALSARDCLAALSQLARLLSQGSHPLALLGPIAGEVRRLLAARQLLDGEVGRRWSSGMSFEEFQRRLLQDGTLVVSGNPYAAYMSFRSAENFTCGKLARYLELVYQADIRLKSSGNPPRIVMERLVLGMCQR